MGQSHPLPELAYNFGKILEYRSCALSRLGDIYVYWQKSSKKLELEKDEFEALFGLLLSDIDSHFAIFRNKGSGLCSFHEVLFTMALFCDAKIETKFYFLLGLKHRSHFKLIVGCNEKIDASYVYETFYRVICGLEKLFKISIPDKVVVVRFSEINFEIFIRRHRDFIYANRSKDKDNDQGEDKSYNGNELSIIDIYNMCQDIKESSDFIASIDEICTYLQLKEDETRDIYNAEQDIKLVNLLIELDSANKSKKKNQNIIIPKNIKLEKNVLFTEKILSSPRNPLWKYTVMDLRNELWCEKMPELNSEDGMFRVLEELVLSKRNAVSIFYKKEKPKENNNNGRRVTNQINQNLKKNKAILDSKHDLFAILDLFSIILWIAECSPRSMKIKNLRAEKEKIFQSENYKSNNDMNVDADSVVNPVDGNSNIDIGKVSKGIETTTLIDNSNKDDKNIIKNVTIKENDKNDSTDTIINTTLTSSKINNEMIEIKKFKLKNKLRNYGRLIELFPNLNIDELVDYEIYNDIINSDAKNKREGTLWGAIGKNFITTTVRYAVRTPFFENTMFPILKENLNRFENSGYGINKNGRGKKSIDYSIDRDGNKIENNEELYVIDNLNSKEFIKLQKNKIKKLNLFINNDILQSDSYLFHVIERFAKGYRNIPFAESQINNTTPTHIISLIDLIRFFRINAVEIFGTRAFTPVTASGFMCKPLVIPVESDLSSALLSLSSNNVESGVIINLNGEICSILSTSIIKFIWYEINENNRKISAISVVDTTSRQSNANANTVGRLSINNIQKLNLSNLNQNLNQNLNLNLNLNSNLNGKEKQIDPLKNALENIKKMQESYLNGLYSGFDLDTMESDFFSILDTPLKYCEKAGDCFLFRFLFFFNF